MLSFIKRKSLVEAEVFSILGTGKPIEPDSAAGEFIENLKRRLAALAGKHLTIRFDNRFGQSGTIFIAYADVPKGAGRLDVLNNRKHVGLAIDGYGPDGSLADEKLKLRKVQGGPETKIRGASGKPDVISKKVVKFLTDLDSRVIESIATRYAVDVNPVEDGLTEQRRIMGIR